MNEVSDMLPIRREDILLSICFCDTPVDTLEQQNVIAFAKKVKERFRFWEFLLFIDADDNTNYDSFINQLGNVRLLRIRHATTLYRRRVNAALEAIGDIVVLTTTGELNRLDLLEMIERASVDSVVVYGQREKSGILAPVLRVLGRVGGYHITGREMLTTAYPRTLLNRLLANPDPELAIRFTPRERGFPLVGIKAATKWSGPRSVKEFGERLTLVEKLMRSSADRLLSLVTIFSFITAGVAILYGFYAIGAWLMLERVQEGWLTTSLILSFTATFLGIALAGICTGLLKIMEIVSPSVFDDIVGERNEIDLLNEVARELNVEVGAEIHEADEQLG